MMDDRSKARWTLVAVVGTLSLLAILLATVLPGKKVQDKRETDSWADKDEDVVEIVKRCPIPGTGETILQLTSGYLEIAKTQENFVEFEGWYAFQVRGPLYEAGVGFKINNVTKTAKWDVDLSEKTIKPRNQEAFIFGGNRELLRY